ncbi:hypothetical protein K2X33_10845 [bacterium]|nr:hypothetical protein [bacterium]
MRAFQISITWAFLSCLSAVAGHERGNSGGILCEEGGTETFELFDLWEARELRKETLIGMGNLSIEAMARKTLRELRGTTGEFRLEAADWLEEAIKFWGREKSFLTGNTAIAPPQDAMNEFTGRNCKPLVGIALWQDRTNSVFFDPHWIARLTPLHRAAVLVHEAVYKTLRNSYRVVDSSLARFITGCAFSTKACEELFPSTGIAAQDRLRCEPTNWAPHDDAVQLFYLFVPGKGEGAWAPKEISLGETFWTQQTWRVQVLRAFGKPVPSQTWADFDFERPPTLLDQGQKPLKSPLLASSSSDPFRNFTVDLALAPQISAGSLWLNGEAYSCKIEKAP